MTFERDRVIALLKQAYDSAEGNMLSHSQALTPDSARKVFTPAAVLVPLIQHTTGITVLLTERATHLSHHSGQVAFPGGMLEPTDHGTVACALREMEEEVGIPAEQVEVLGSLISYRTLTGFCVAPIVGVIVPPVQVRPDPREVAATFEVPLDFVCQIQNRREVSANVGGVLRSFYEILWDGHRIWGATAAILVNLSCALIGKDAYSDMCYGDRA